MRLFLPAWRDRNPAASPGARWFRSPGVRAVVPFLLLLPALGGLRHATAGDALPAALDARLRAALVSTYAAARQTPAVAEPSGDAGADLAGARAVTLRPVAGALVPCFIEGTASRAALEQAGARVGSEIGGVFTARVPLRRLAPVAGVPGVRRMRAAARLEPTLDLSRIDTRAALVQDGLPDTARGITGENVMVGVVDTGIAWQHADFKTLLGQTRIATLWDQTDSLGPAPAGYGYGTEWSAPQIDLGICRERDSTYFGHGTHVAGIAAGNGRGTGNGFPQFRYVGVAPRAHLGIVNTTFYETDIADGVAWLFQRADALGLPCVVNLSLGTSYGPHDGTGSLDIALNALSGPGHIVVAGAGNENRRATHAEAVAPPVGDALITFLIFGYSPSVTAPDGLSIDGWYEGGDNLALTIRTPNGTLVGPVPKGASLALPTPDGWVSIDQTGTEGMNTNGDVEVLIEVSDAAGIPPTAGYYEIRVSRIAAPGGGLVDFWIYDQTFSHAANMAQGRTERKIVLSPASADSVIAVAAHTTRASWQAIDGNTYNFGNTLDQIGTFSSIGPRRDNVLKPDLSAPGTAIGSAHSPQSQPNPVAYILPDGVHKIIQGTSMSSPHVAGAVALMLAGCRIISPTEVRAFLAGSCRADAFTGAVPNPTWGYGKLDLERLFRNLNAFTIGIDAPQVVPPGTPVTLTAACMTGDTFGWRIPTGIGQVTDSRGWLVYQNGGPPSPVPVFTDSTGPVDPGQTACIPRVGQIRIDVPPGAPPNDSTLVTFTMEPGGLAFMRQTVFTTVRVAGVSATPREPARPAELGVRVFVAERAHIVLELAQPAAGPVRMALVDVAGRRIASLLNANVPEGFRRVEWRGDADGRLAAGLYFVTVESDHARVSRRVLLTR